MSQHPTPVTAAYQTLCETGAIEDDPAQRALAARLDAVSRDLERARVSSKSSPLGWLFARRTQTPAKGLYIHGGVGRGKSMLMDMFFSLAGEKAKRRVHFSAFMQDAHQRIHDHRRAFKAGKTAEPDPIRPVARALEGEARLLCFDEFSVTDIADAMVLGRLFEAMFEAGAVIVATSNTAPDDLYADGLNRSLFLPFTAILKAHCTVFALNARIDYRLEKERRGQAYFSPANATSEAMMTDLWRKLTAGDEEEAVIIPLKGRSWRVEKAAGGAAWLTFAELCEAARGAADYLALSARFDTLFVDNVPMMDIAARNQARRFIQLVDILYDRNVRLIISAAANPHALYVAASGSERFEFQRTASRLIEMQSADYQQRVAAAAGAAASNS